MASQKTNPAAPKCTRFPSGRYVTANHAAHLPQGREAVQSLTASVRFSEFRTPAHQMAAVAHASVTGTELSAIRYLKYVQDLHNTLYYVESCNAVRIPAH